MIAEQENIPTERTDQQKNQNANETNTWKKIICLGVSVNLLFGDGRIHVHHSRRRRHRRLSISHRRNAAFKWQPLETNTQHRRRRCCQSVQVNLSIPAQNVALRWKLIRKVYIIVRTHTHKELSKSSAKTGEKVSSDKLRRWFAIFNTIMVYYYYCYRRLQ